jgi:hypothetical protein
MQTIYALFAYVFNPLPPIVFHYYLPLAVVAIASIVFSIFLRISIKKNNQDKPFRRLFRGFPAKLETVSVIMALCLLARYYRIAFLSMRALLALAFLTWCYFIYKLLLTFLKAYPAEKKRHYQQMEKNKYMPGKKHR